MSIELPMLKGNLKLNLGDFSLQTGDFELPLDGVTVLFGRSGSGKSTFLRALAGLEAKAKGTLHYAEQSWQGEQYQLPIQQRHIGFVFQDAALFPHMDVRGNLNYAVKRLPKDTTPADFDEIISRLNIAELLDRPVHNLSGGERQRVAIARALLTKPQVLCMDEPLSALDWQAKAEILSLIEELVESLKIPLLYITHSPAEVERLADHIVFLEGGKVTTVETLQEALSKADSPLFAEQGAVSVLQGRALEVVDALRPIQMGENTMWLSDTSELHKAKVRVRVLAKDVSLALSDPDQLSIMNHLPAEVLELIEEPNNRILVRLQLSDQQKLFAEITQHSAKRLGLQIGTKLYALIKSVALAE